MFEFHISSALEKLSILGVGTRPATFNESHANSIQTLGNAKLVDARKGEPFRLGAVT